MQDNNGFFHKIWESIRTFFHQLKQAIGSLFHKKPDPDSDEDGSTIVLSASDATKIKQLAANDPAANAKDTPPVIPPSQLTGKGRTPSTSFKKRESRPLFILGVILTTSKVAIIAIAILCVAALGAVLGVANAYLGTTPELDLEAIQDNDLTSYIYDRNGTLVTTYSATENRDYATLDEIPDLVQKAFISIEDVRFYYHSGVDLKRLISAGIGNLTGSSTSGGSTITQQLIKNQMLTSERSYKRKIQEAYLAIQLEQKYSKDQILEAYLNTIALGGSNYGVKAAAKDYFGKELNELTLRETACLAGITQYPFAYNPRTCYYGAGNIDALNARINEVLNAMYEAGYISLDELNAAEADDLTVIEKSTYNSMYDHAHFIEYAVEDVINRFLEQRGLENTAANRQSIENELRTSGYHIYTTLDTRMQEIMQTAMTEYDYPSLLNKSDSVIEETDVYGNTTIIEQPQAAAVIIDQSNGQIVAMCGSRTSPTAKKTSNRATSNSTLVGSSIKPIAVYGPALDAGAGLGTIIENIPVPISGWNTKEGYPTSSQGTYGPTSIQTGIVDSLNIVAARTLTYHSSVDNAYNYLLSLGVDSENLNKDGIGMTLGTSGISALNMTAAYAAIANGGVYIEPISFTTVTDSHNEVILNATDTQESRQVYKASTTYMLVEALTNAVESGTGKSARISGITVAGKTGTNAKNRGVFFSGMTGYYTSCVWVGHDYFKQLASTSGGRGAAPLWQDYMSQILEGLENKPILAGSASDYGVKGVTVCSVSGMLATEACAQDASHPPATYYFASDSTPQEHCTLHQVQNVCSISGQIAGEYCPVESVASGGVLVLPADSDYLRLDQAQLLSIFPNLYQASYSEDGTMVTETCSLHTAEWAATELFNTQLSDAITNANNAISAYSSFIASYDVYLSDADRYTLSVYVNALKECVYAMQPDPVAITSATTALNNAMSNMLANISSQSQPPEADDE